MTKNGVKINYRNEIKYICSERQIAIIEGRLKAICKKDPHAGEKGMYTIRSVYFDDYDNTCFYENENGTDPREKYRIRIYNGNKEYISLECKRKENGKTSKESCLLTYDQCQAMLNGTFSDAIGKSTLLNKFLLQYSMRPLRPKIIVEYERVPYTYPIGNVRITFDRNIGVSRQVAKFLEQGVSFRPVMPWGQHILEVKYDELLPDCLYNAMQIREIHQVAYSKYYICRKFCI